MSKINLFLIFFLQETSGKIINHWILFLAKILIIFVILKIK